ncbi:glycoside hydrolase family 35 protein [Streptomyces candidus]|uniref:Beta-galactosidase n=1 Tax=Streptomyces candidus TaxID=67283 RepID=A0A7X0HE92_9ACTN|nr:beta-galactosidase family protein [Streptomyces candidus]MBB6436014.1 beta-galactosidase [Streptomyces candidus]GHH43342.1 beta-galactosidase [Streptomyces candidus]
MFRTSPEGFSLDGRPLRLLSGALHYFRVLPEQWPHRLRQLRALGLNTVETYVPWNLHEPRPGEYDFEGLADLDAFLHTTRAAGLHAIVRPSPYICAEWENGGLPWWLGADREVRAVRCQDPAYLAHVTRWYDRLMPVIAPHQTTRGGNVLMLQIENEYGSYGTDTGYLEWIADAMTRRGIDVPLCTSDGPDDFFLTGGTVPGRLATVNFGSRASEAFTRLARVRPEDPVLCMEFWCGWFDHWGDGHTVREPADAAAALAEILDAGASVNLYMAHGGTNFSTWAGANTGDPATGAVYQPDVTSYDYDAPIDEQGGATAKFRAFREVLARYTDGPLPEPEPPAPLLPAGRLELGESVRLFDVWDALAGKPVCSPHPPSFEELGIGQGLVRYASRIPGPRGPYPLSVQGLADRAHVFVDGEPRGVLERDGADRVEGVAVDGPGARVELLVESMGRVNYGVATGESKGVHRVLHTQQQLHGWSARALELGHGIPAALSWPSGVAGAAGGAGNPGAPGPAGARGEPGGTGPVFHRGFLDLGEGRLGHDALVALPGWTKGYLWVNGFCLGRYWDRGPQRTLYVPWPLLRAGRNEVVVLELDGCAEAAVELLERPDLG